MSAPSSPKGFPVFCACRLVQRIEDARNAYASARRGGPGAVPALRLAVEGSMAIAGRALISDLERAAGPRPTTGAVLVVVDLPECSCGNLEDDLRGRRSGRPRWVPGWLVLNRAVNAHGCAVAWPDAPAAPGVAPREVAR